MSPQAGFLDDRRGAALVFTLLIGIAVAAMALGALMVSSGATLSTRFTAREASMQAAANGGLEIIRDSLNHGNFDSLLPMNGYTTLIENAPIVDAYGVTMPRTTRSLYVGRTGGRTGGAATAGQYGSNFSSGLSVIRDQRGAVAARRMLMTQESWSKFAVAINDWPGSAVYGCNESIAGPFHSNDVLRLQGGCNPKIAFHGAATVVGSVTNQTSGNFMKGIKTGVAPIEWPTPARIVLMKQFAADGDAADGDYDWTSPTTGSHTPGLRIEFLTIDVNGNNSIEWDEGFMRVWLSKNTSDSALAYTTGRRWVKGYNNYSHTSGNSDYNNDPNVFSRNCGGLISIGGTYKWYTARAVYDSVRSHGGSHSNARTAVRWLLSRGNTGSRQTPINNTSTVTEVQCYLGGDPTLYHATYGTEGANALLSPALTPDDFRTDTTGQPLGAWQKRRTSARSSVSALRGDAAYLIPLGKNPNYKGVIFVTGDVAISGILRGRTSVFATGNIVLADDLLYYTPPGTKCDAEGDIFGAIATINVLIADNNVQTPFRVDGTLYGGYDDTPADEQYHMFFLAAGDGTSGKGNFFTTGLNGVPGPTPPYRLSTGSNTLNSSAVSERCANAPAGCIRITGGLAQGKVEYYTYSAYNATQAYGYAEAHTYDKCGASNPPPYFPTTGRFIENRYYEVDPVWLSDKGIADYFADIRAQ
ncbi:MAG TPA: hypothetical protein PLL69_02755 [Gemmatimonadales bacterium]|nr:hypothetical protein [Gemmatimonadales bacterium]